jgi:hypothetical protein
MRRAHCFLSLTILSLLIISIGAAGCSSNGPQTAEHNFDMAPMSKMPKSVQEAPVAVQEAYQFAVANSEVASQIPCYCGCGAMGHTSNYACFVADDSNGEIAFDEHALGCSICVDIAQDTMRLLDEGQSVDEIFTYVDNTYSRFGPPTPLEQSTVNGQQ